jgi:hypothetical protein
MYTIKCTSMSVAHVNVSCCLIFSLSTQVPVTFEFIKKLDDSSYCKDWLNIEPYSGFIMPGNVWQYGKIVYL